MILSYLKMGAGGEPLIYAKVCVCRAQIGFSNTDCFSNTDGTDDTDFMDGGALVR